MIVQLGQRSRHGDVDALLSECHLRIRRFVSLARRIPTQPQARAEEVKDVAAQIVRYFTLGFPLHLLDEDELVMPRLIGQDRELDLALARMHADHGEHAGHVARVVELCVALEREPHALATLSTELAGAAAALHAVIEPHLLLEERVIFPALRLLPPPVRDEIRAGMQARRQDGQFGATRLPG